jgi:hypothetical protein
VSGNGSDMMNAMLKVAWPQQKTQDCGKVYCRLQKPRFVERLFLDVWLINSWPSKQDESLRNTRVRNAGVSEAERSHGRHYN